VNYQLTKSAICFGNLKQAGLYFDSVIPIAFRVLRGGAGFPDVFFDIPEEIPASALVNLVFGITPKDHDEKWRHVGKFIDQWGLFARSIHALRSPKTESSRDDHYEDVKALYLSDASADGISVRQEFSKLAASLGRNCASVIIADDPNEVGEHSYAVLSLSNVALVDTSKASWEQIVELRNDPDACQMLRNLRLFFQNTYQGQSQAYIEDDLAHRLEDYDKARRKLGFDAVVGSLGTLLDSKNLQATAAAGIAAAFLGGPVTGIATAGVVELGKFSLEVGNRLFAIKQFRQSHELAYILHARSNLDAR